jgi:hypothetical protein
MNGTSAPTQDDGGIACDADGILTLRYYLWGDKRIPYRRHQGSRSLR